MLRDTHSHCNLSPAPVGSSQGVPAPAAGAAGHMSGGTARGRGACWRGVACHVLTLVRCSGQWDTDLLLLLLLWTDSYHE